MEFQFTFKSEDVSQPHLQLVFTAFPFGIVHHFDGSPMFPPFLRQFMGSLSQVSTLCRDLSSRSQARQLLGESGRDPTPAGHWQSTAYLDDPRVSLVRSKWGPRYKCDRDVKRRQDCSIKICDFGLQGGSSGSHGCINFVGSQCFFLGSTCKAPGCDTGSMNLAHQRATSGFHIPC